MKAIDFKVEDLSITRGNGYGQYYVTTVVNGDKIKAHTTNSEAFDWFNDDENLEKHEEAKPKWWVIENPANGRLKEFLGKPKYVYQPWEFGSPWTKKTALWGEFNIPQKKYTK